MRTLLIGSGNPNKIELYLQLARRFSLKLVMPADLQNFAEPEETGRTLEENAILKAKHYCKLTGLPTLSDDAGFEIPALNNFPGVLSRRFAGKEMTDEEIIAGILEKMWGLQGAQRAARMRVVIALALDADKVYTASGALEGVVPEKPYPKIQPRFPYRSLLYITKLDKWSYKLNTEDEERLGYRAATVKKLYPYLEKL